MARVAGHIGWREASAPKGAPEAYRPSPLVTGSLYLVVAVYAFTFAALSILRHDAFQTNAFDLGNMDQAVWNTAHGRWFQFSNWDGGDTRLAAHVEPILVPISLLYHIYASPKTLLVLQSVVMSLGALPAYWLARDHLRNDFAGVAFASAYLLSPGLEAANLFDFHAVALASSFLLFAFYFADRRRYWAFFAFAVLAMATKEQLPLAVLLMGLYIAFVQRRRVPGLLTVGVALVWVVVALGVVIPHFNPDKGSPYFSRYDDIGASPRHIMSNLVFHPGRVLSHLFERQKWDYVYALFSPVSFLALLSPITLVFALPDLALNLLSNTPAMYSNSYHYSAVIVPFVVISGVFGVRVLVTWSSRASPKLGPVATYALCGLILAASLRGFYHAQISPMGDHLPRQDAHDRLAGDIMKLVPSDAAVATTSALNPHLSHRERLYLFCTSRLPDNHCSTNDAEYVFLDVTSTPYPTNVPDLHWQAQSLIESQDWGVAAARDGYLLLQRGAPDDAIGDDFYSFARYQGTDYGRRVGARFGDSLVLVGFELDPGPTVHGPEAYVSLTMYWRAAWPVDQDYRIIVYLLDEHGKTLWAEPYQAATVWYPTSGWQREETVRVSVEQVPMQGMSRATLCIAVAENASVSDPAVRMPVDCPGAPEGVAVDDSGQLLRLAELERK